MMLLVMIQRFCDLMLMMILMMMYVHAVCSEVRWGKKLTTCYFFLCEDFNGVKFYLLEVF